MPNKQPPAKGQGVIPEDFAQANPRDLYNTSDIRFVMLEIGKLTSSVDRLIKDVETQSGKVEKLSHQASFLKGGIALAILLMTIFAWIIDHKWDNLTKVLATLQISANANTSNKKSVSNLDVNSK